MAGDKPWPQVPVGNKDHANAAVVIIGAGVSGLCTAIDLVKRNNCHNFIIFEKSAGLGGTWRDNKYPGCCCDIESALYSYSFEQNPDWTHQYPGQEEFLDYLVSVAQKYDLYRHIRFNTTIEDARWDDEAKKWRTMVTTASGSKENEFNPEYEISSDFLVSAVGQLNIPRYPDIPGVDDFDGKKMHSARWDLSYDLTDKKIAVIGNGATAVQILPEIAKVAKHVTVFQRTPHWVIPRQDAPVSPFYRNLYKYVPPIKWRKRAGQMDFRESYSYLAVTDGESPFSGGARISCTEQMHAALPGQEDLWKKLTPTYNPGCKRIIVSDDYYPALALPNVSLETRPIADIRGRAVNVVGENGEATQAEDDYDLLVLATGFRTMQFMHPITIYGKNGRPLSEIWKDGAKAYYGTCVEDLPNFGMLYGPNTNLGHTSVIMMIEAQSRYINGLISSVLSARKAGKSLSMTPKESKIEAYNEKVQKVLRNSSFADPNCISWYKNEAGLITNNYPGRIIEYQNMLSKVDLDDYELDGSGKDIASGKKVVNVGRVHEETMVSDKMLAAFSVLSVAVVVGWWVAQYSLI